MNISKQATNVAYIEGVFLEAELREDVTNVEQKPYIAGTVTVGVEQKVAGKMEYSEIPVSVFAAKFKNDGKPNPAYKNIKKLETEYISKAAGADTGKSADNIRIARGELVENAFKSQDGQQTVSMWRVRNAFFEQVKSDFSPRATFKTQIVILNMKAEVDRDGVETGRLIIKGGVVQYGGRVDVVQFIVEDPNAIAHINNNWHENETVNVAGIIRHMATSEQKIEEVGFGEAIPETVTRTKRELIVTTGSPSALDEEHSYLIEDIKKALVDRSNRIDESAAKAKEKADKAEASQKGFGDGF